MRPRTLAALLLTPAASLVPACSTTSVPSSPPTHTAHAARAETVADFASLIPLVGPSTATRPVRLERVTAGVPWPRGMAWVDRDLVVLARGRHRRAGGVDGSIEDQCGTLLRVDPDVAEPVVADTLAGAAVHANASVMARPGGEVFELYDGTTDPILDTRMDRPYCTLIHDPVSQNLFVCGFSGVDLPGAKFRKNATDSIHRFDMRTGRWYPVEMHDASVVPQAELGYVVSNAYYPHHDPAANSAPHGWLNGPDGGCVAGRYLYCVGKDNHAVAQYDLAAIRADPNAPAPPSRLVLGPRVRVRHPLGEREMEVLGPSAAVLHGDHLYLGYRTSSVVLRFRVEADGALQQPAIGELVAVFEPWDATRKRSANLIDMAFNSRGELFVSCAKNGRIWNVGRPNPSQPFYGNDMTTRPPTAPPYVDLRALTGKKTNCGNITFDRRDRLYLCSGNYDTDTALAGVVYRAVPFDQ